MNSIFPIFYCFAVIIILWQAFRIMTRGSNANYMNNSNNKLTSEKQDEDRTGLLTIHPELLDQEGKITDEELLTVRFTGDNEPPPSPEASEE